MRTWGRGSPSIGASGKAWPRETTDNGKICKPPSELRMARRLLTTRTGGRGSRSARVLMPLPSGQLAQAGQGSRGFRIRRCRGTTCAWPVAGVRSCAREKRRRVRNRWLACRGFPEPRGTIGAQSMAESESMATRQHPRWLGWHPCPTGRARAHPSGWFVGPEWQWLTEQRPACAQGLIRGGHLPAKELRGRGIVWFGGLRRADLKVGRKCGSRADWVVFFFFYFLFSFSLFPN